MPATQAVCLAQSQHFTATGANSQTGRLGKTPIRNGPQAMHDKFWYLKNCDLLARLTAEQIARLEARCRQRRFERGCVLYAPSDQSDAVFLLTSGHVKLYHITPDGKQAVLAFIEPGELFGELACVDAAMREEFAETMEQSTVVLIPREEMQRLIQEHPHVSQGVSTLLGLRTRRVERRLKSLLFRSNRDRLIHFLLELAEKYGQRTPEGVLLGIKLSHQDLAGVIGSTRETVTVLLGELQREGRLSVKRRQVIVKDLARLAASIDESPPSLRTESKQEMPVAPFRPSCPQ